MSRAQLNLLDEMIVDNFAGGGGTSTGIELATGRVVDVAINHDPDAILGKTKQVARCGNAVPPPFATALVRANLPEWCHKEIATMAELEREVAV